MLTAATYASVAVKRGHSATYADVLSICRAAQNLVVITGAGVSTESGIPDYRSPTGSYSKGHKPMTHDEFIGSDASRRRYWARSLKGYTPFAAKLPNEGHHALASLEAAGIVNQLITQNVDGLHQRAGSRRIIELHGTSHSCTCLQCGAKEQRSRVQLRMAALNHWWLQTPVADSAMRSDGDAEVEVPEEFRVPPCEACGSTMLKPDVTFFGDMVPPERASAAAATIADADALLIAGTSLSTLSAFRLVDACARANKPIAMINRGETRAERAGLTLLKLEARCGETLRRLETDLVG